MKSALFQFERLEERLAMATIVGTAFNDVFEMTYSANSVAVTISTDTGPPTSLGTFPLNETLAIDGSTGIDWIRVVGTLDQDVFNVSAPSIGVNGATVLRNNTEYLTLSGRLGNDTYRFDADDNQREFTELVERANEGTDTIDFSMTTSTGISIDLQQSNTQSIRPGYFFALQHPIGSGGYFENVIGGAGNDTISGNQRNNTLMGNGGNDIFSGREGNDSLVGGAGDDSYLFLNARSAEADTITEGRGEGSDTLYFSKISTPVTFSLASASIQNAHTNRTLKLNSALTFENLVGGSASDILTGNTLNNRLTGGSGNDVLTGGAGDDSMFGGKGDDSYVFAASPTPEKDTVAEEENSGNDTLNFVLLNVPVTLDLASGQDQNVHTNRTLKLNSGVTFENAIGGSAGDTLIGNGKANSLSGNGGHDILLGRAGNDSLRGGGDRDLLIGNQGEDALDGGAGDDILIGGNTHPSLGLPNLIVVRSIWTSNQDYSSRVFQLQSGFGVNSLRPGVNVGRDFSVNSLTGAAGRDWFFAATIDNLVDRSTNESLSLL